MAKVENTIRNGDHHRSRGPATILAIGTALPVYCFPQVDFPDFYFRITKSEHLTQLKEKFRRMCEKSMIQKRYLHMSEEIMNKIPGKCSYTTPSLNARLEIVNIEVPKLGKEAALKAIKEWGQPKSRITHLIFCTTTSLHMPGADYQLAKILGLEPNVKRVMLYLQGCFAGGTALRIAKDLSENNPGARVLIVCSEITTLTFMEPSEARLNTVIGQALFGDGAAAVIVGSDPDTSIEHSLFQIVSANQTFIADTEEGVQGDLSEVGLIISVAHQVPHTISDNIEKCMVEAFTPLGINDWNSLFYIVHPGGRAILDQIEGRLNLKEDKLEMSRHVLSEYGNVVSSCVFFIMDEMRRKSIQEDKSTTGFGSEWGVLFGLGPGVTIETVVLRSVPTSTIV